MPKRIASFVALAGTWIIAVVAALLIVVQTMWFKEWARQQFVDLASRYLRADLEVASLGGNLFTEVVLHGVALTLDGRPTIAVERAEIDYNLLELLRGASWIEAVSLMAPIVHVRRSEDGLNVASLLSPRRREGRAVSFAIGRIEVHDGIVTLDQCVVTTERVRLPSRLTNVDAELSFVRSPYIGTVLDIHWMTFAGYEPEISVESLSARVVFEGGLVRIEEFLLDTERTNRSVTHRSSQWSVPS